jgi:FKBP-type peptidyl-prolyl cis-trans isomerase/cyclophilin family peptidyl-prolyl cis-trans isomerase
MAVLMGALGLLAGSAHGEDDAEKGDSLHPRVKMETTLGDMTLELDGEKAPITVLNFIQYAQDKYYDGTIFHRVKSDFMIQGGGFTPALDQKTEGLRAPIRNEWNNGLKNVTGTIAMARRREPDSATSQFFINVVDNARLDQPMGGAAYCVFGKVVEGMETVEKIRDTPVEVNPKYRGGRVVPIEPVVIKSVRLVSEFDREKVSALAKASEEKAAAAAAAAEEAKKKAAEERAEKARAHVEKLEKELGKKAITTDSGLAYFVLVEGDGPSPNPTDRVEVHYTGWLLDGTQFDSSVDRGTPAEFPLNGVIRGWTEGVGLMKVGAKHKLVIPPELAYGVRGRASIPPNATLVFDIELLGIK